MVEERRVDVLDDHDSFKAGEIRVVDFQEIVRAFESGSEPVDVEELEDLSPRELVGDERELGLEVDDDELGIFLEESERAGKSSPVLYVPDQYYENLPSGSEGSVEVGAIDGTLPVRLLPLERDLFANLNRFSFGGDVKRLLEGEETAVLVNPSGDETYNGDAYVEVGENVAERAYERAVSDERGLEYLRNQRGVGVVELGDDGAVEIQVDETGIGRDFDYRVEDDVLVLELGDETVEVGYSGEVHEASTDAYEDVVDPRADEDAKIYKFVIEE